MSSDPYKSLTESIKSLTEPMNELLANHSEYMATNLSILNNVKPLNNFQMLLSHKVNQDVEEKERGMGEEKRKESGVTGEIRETGDGEGGNGTKRTNEEINQ